MFTSKMNLTHTELPHLGFYFIFRAESSVHSTPEWLHSPESIKFPRIKDKLLLNKLALHLHALIAIKQHTPPLTLRAWGRLFYSLAWANTYPAEVTPECRQTWAVTPCYSPCVTCKDTPLSPLASTATAEMENSFQPGTFQWQGAGKNRDVWAAWIQEGKWELKLWCKTYSKHMLSHSTPLTEIKFLWLQGQAHASGLQDNYRNMI